MLLTQPHSMVRINWPPDEATSERFAALSSAYANLPRARDLISEAHASGWPVYVNETRSSPPVGTWRGDMLCAWHLAQAQQERDEPVTVRMAQWGRR